MVNRKHNAMTLVEVLLAVVLVAIIALPLWDMLVTTRLVTASADELSQAVTLAATAMSQLRSLPKSKLQELAETVDEKCGYGLTKAPPPFNRFIEITDTGTAIGSNKVFFVKVTLRWKSPRVKRQLDYTLEGLLQ